MVPGGVSRCEDSALAPQPSMAGREIGNPSHGSARVVRMALIPFARERRLCLAAAVGTIVAIPDADTRKERSIMTASQRRRRKQRQRAQQDRKRPSGWHALSLRRAWLRW